jgi:hypothetical protein
VSIEEFAERRRRPERARDDLGVGARTHHVMFLTRGGEFGSAALSLSGEG